MNPATLLSDLRRRGVELTAEGDRLRYRAPRGVLSPELLDDLRSHKREILAKLTQYEDSAEEDALKSGVPVAFLIDSPQYGEVWVATDAGVAAAIQVEEQQRERPRPVLMAEDVAHLEHKSEKAIRGALNVCAIFPGAKVLR